MTRTILIICVLLVTNPIYAQLNYDTFRGKWQERSRSIKNKSIKFDDTLQLDFYKRDTVVLRNGSGVSYRGGVLFVKDTLYASSVPFKVLQVSGYRLLLQDSLGMRTLVKVKRFHHDNLGLRAVATDDLSEPRNVGLNQLRGKWEVYRTEAAPGVAEDSLIIRGMEISSGGIAKMEFQNKKISFTSPATIQKSRVEYKLRLEDHIWPFHIYKLNRQEMVFGNHGGIVYFAKRKS